MSSLLLSKIFNPFRTFVRHCTTPAARIDRSKFVNKITLLGYTTKELVIKDVPFRSSRFAEFIMVTRSIRRTKEGIIRERVDYHSIVTYSFKCIARLEKYFTKGTRIHVEGSLSSGNKFNSKPKIIADSIILLSDFKNYDETSISDMDHIFKSDVDLEEVDYDETLDDDSEEIEISKEKPETI